MAEPMIKLDPEPTLESGAPILSYNVPEPTSYTGYHRIEISIVPKGRDKADYFVDIPKVDLLQIGEEQKRKTEGLKAFRSTLKGTETTEFIVFNVLNITYPSFTKNYNLTLEKLKLDFTNFDLDFAIRQSEQSFEIRFYFTNYNRLAFTYSFLFNYYTNKPRLLIIETYRLSSFLGSYGAGRTIKTFSLLPGEKTKISVRTYRRTEDTRRDASCILDSYSDATSDTFERSVGAESTLKKADSENKEWHIEAEASASWGWGSVDISGGMKGATNSSREEFAKNIQNATSKHAASASAKRDVQINTNTESKVSEGEETEIVREIENINVSRTLNFVFRQMNQEFISILHMVDVRLGFFDGTKENQFTYTLPEIDNFLETFIRPDKREEVKTNIKNQLLHILDYKDNIPQPYDENGKALYMKLEKGETDEDKKPMPFIREKKYPESEVSYYSFAKDYYSQHKDVTGRKILVEGIILSIKKNVLRTDGIIVDTLLGQGEALDTYSQGLQLETVREKQIGNAKAELANSIIENKDAEKAKLFEQIYPCCSKSQSNSLIVNPKE